MGVMQRAMLLWMMDATERDAVLLHDSISGLGTKDTALIGLCAHVLSHSYTLSNKLTITFTIGHLSMPLMGTLVATIKR
jgi:hypothetical protein